MKRIFLAVLGALSVLIIGLVIYGTYLNQRGEAQITERMSNRSIPLRGAAVQQRQLKPRLTIDTMNLYSDHMADSVALIDGRITEMHVQKHDYVTQGQVLFTLTNENQPIKMHQADIDLLKADNDILKAENDIMRAETALAKAKNDYARYSRLRGLDAVTAEKYEEVEAAYREAEVQAQSSYVQRDQLVAQRDYYASQKERLMLEIANSQVRAPIDGEVLIMYRPQGSYVTAGTAMALVGDFKKLNFSMPVDNESAQRLSIGQTATVNFQRSDFSKIYDTEYESGNAGKSQEFTATLKDINPPLDEPAEMRKIVWELDNRAGLLEPQTYNNVSIQSYVAHSCLAVPVSAMIDPSRTTVFVVDAEGKLAKRQVLTGVDDGKYIEILGGLNEGEIVVTSGTDGLEDGMKADITLESGDL